MSADSDAFLGSLIRSARVAAGLTPLALARAAGIEPLELARLEAGSVPWRLAAARIADGEALDTSPTDRLARLPFPPDAG
jgi:transcriptional regulator with XRE-family HTH domain